MKLEIRFSAYKSPELPRCKYVRTMELPFRGNESDSVVKELVRDTLGILGYQQPVIFQMYVVEGEITPTVKVTTHEHRVAPPANELLEYDKLNADNIALMDENAKLRSQITLLTDKLAMYREATTRAWDALNPHIGVDEQTF